MNKVQVFLAIGLVTLLVIVTACLPNQWFGYYTEDGELVDWIYSVEERSNGVVVLWMRHDDAGAFCFEKDIASKDDLRKMMLDGRRVAIKYKDMSFISTSSCKSVESSIEGSGFQAYSASSIEQLAD